MAGGCGLALGRMAELLLGDGLPVSWQEFVEAIHFVPINPPKNVGQVCKRVNVEDSAGLNQREKDSRGIATVLASYEHPVTAIMESFP
jgi:hypothetical protein